MSLCFYLLLLSPEFLTDILLEFVALPLVEVRMVIIARILGSVPVLLSNLPDLLEILNGQIVCLVARDHLALEPEFIIPTHL